MLHSHLASVDRSEIINLNTMRIEAACEEEKKMILHLVRAHVYAFV